VEWKKRKHWKRSPVLGRVAKTYRSIEYSRPRSCPWIASKPPSNQNLSREAATGTNLTKKPHAGICPKRPKYIRFTKDEYVISIGLGLPFHTGISLEFLPFLTAYKILKTGMEY
jgi:hypothetical protein